MGTRSAVFAPFERLGLIILDEEQESTYKSESTPGITPGMWPNSAVHTTRRCWCFLRQRLLWRADMPPRRDGILWLVCPIGMARLNCRRWWWRTWLRNGFRGIFPFSQVLLEGLEKNLASKQQSILLLNRRGYHTFVSCKACGEVVTCPSCSISMTYHSANHRLMCHYCGYSVPFTSECPHCHEREVRYAGSGTQRADERASGMLAQKRGFCGWIRTPP